jgi:hypothetical protein
MFCPGCGADGQTANAYCKRCGDWLPEFKRRSSAAFGGETPQQNVFTGLFMSALSAVVALFSAIALYATYLGTDEAKWSIYLAAAFCLCIAGWQVSSFIVGLKLRNRLNRARAGVEGDSQLQQTTAAPVLPPADMSNFVRAQSVTENTTELLQPVDRPQGNDSQHSRG